MGTRIDPRQQFSKWLARWTAVFWFFYMAYLATIMYLQPGVSDAVVYLSIIISVVMVVNVWAYTKNSVLEKAFLSGMEAVSKNPFQLTWKKASTTTTTVAKTTEPEPEGTDDSEESDESDDEAEG